MSEFLSNDEFNELRVLISQALDGMISRDGIERMEDILESSSRMRAYYREYLSVYCDLTTFLGCQQLNAKGGFNSTDIINREFWEDLANYENIAPGIENPEEEQKRELIQKVLYPPREKRTLSKFSMFSSIFSVAAILFIAMFIQFAPPKSGYETATLVDTINAKWADKDAPMQKGTRIVTGNTGRQLKSGFAELLFDNNTRVTIEGPAEFQVVMSDQIILNYGKLYATVPQEAIGFTVNTKTAKVVDLGTEFGVQAEASGDTLLHVIKGKTTLIAGEKSGKMSLEVNMGHARKVSGVTRKVTKIVYNDHFFVRDINSSEGLVWRGQKTINLADIVGGGNGFGTGKQFSALTLKDMLVSSNMPMELLSLQQSVNTKIQSNRFIDSLFIPKGKTRICSQEEIVTEFPDTSGLTFGCVTNGGIVASEEDRWGNVVRLGNHEYGTSDSPMIHLHPNLGVTFNLNWIRKSISGLKIIRFTSLCGISETAQQMSKYTTPSHVDFWILVDGVVRFKKENVVLGSGPIPIDISLNADDRFLSLAATDSDGSILYDWAIFAQPKLEISSE